MQCLFVLRRKDPDLFTPRMRCSRDHTLSEHSVREKTSAMGLLHNAYISDPSFTQRICWRSFVHTTHMLAIRRSHNGYIGDLAFTQRIYWRSGVYTTDATTDHQRMGAGGIGFNTNNGILLIGVDCSFTLTVRWLYSIGPLRLRCQPILQSLTHAMCLLPSLLPFYRTTLYMRN